MDEVFDYGWAYGSNGGDKLKNRKVALAVSAGIRSSDYRKEGRYGHTLEQILIPFETTFFSIVRQIIVLFMRFTAKRKNRVEQKRRS